MTQSSSPSYTRSYFAGLADASFNAAATLLPDIYALYAFRSVVDFGCGTASWLRAAASIIPEDEPGRRLTGIDGPYAQVVAHCDGAHFVFQDLENRVSIDRHDLVVCVEVAEHLTPGRAESFIDDLCRASDVVFFGAAVDGQGGVDHFNERPQSYWAALFASHGYHPYIFHRVRHWDNPVFADCPWYIGNSFLYVNDAHPLSVSIATLRAGAADILDVVHPQLLRLKKPENVPFRQVAKQVMPSLMAAVRRRLGHGSALRNR